MSPLVGDVDMEAKRSVKFFDTIRDRWHGSAGQRAGEGEPQRARVPDGLRVYVVGDVHGRSDLLAQMSVSVAQDLAGSPVLAAGGGAVGWEGGGPWPPQGAVTVFLGDYIDRGPESKAVLDRLCDRDWPTPILALMGNHELMCLQFVHGNSSAGLWRQVGAMPTLASYGIDVSPMLAATPDDAALEAIRAELTAALMPRHLGFMTTELLPWATVGDYFFCHAGARPGVPLDRQDPLDLLTIREPFLTSVLDHGKIVVHGHTPTEAPVVRSNRIGIDTGAYATGCLTCLVLEGDAIRFIQT